MVRTSGIRDKFTSNALKQLKQERGTKRSKNEAAEKQSDTDSDDDMDSRRESKPKSANSLLCILPKPKNANSFGPTVKLDKLLKMPERAKDFDEHEFVDETAQTVGDDGIVEFNANKILQEPVAISASAKLDQESARIVVPKGKEKQKNQITYLAQLSKATEMEHKEQAAQGRFNKTAARAKYGW